MFQDAEKINKWDVVPEQIFFDELKRVSKNQVIWGGNYFPLPPTRCMVAWDKCQQWETFSQIELAWTSFDYPAKLFKYDNRTTDKLHPCLPAGEKVFINDSWVNIEDVKIGDKSAYGVVVDTSSHYADKLVEIATANGKTIATWNHPFLILRNGCIAWCNADQITSNDFILWRIIEKKIPNEPKRGICDLEERNVVENKNYTTFLFGNSITEKFLMAIKYIIKTLTKKTIRLKTYSLSRPLNTKGYTKVASLRTVFGISHVKYVESLSRAQRSFGILTKDTFLEKLAKHVMLRRSSEIVNCELHKVISVNTILRKTKVYNLTIANVPVFDTQVGVSHNTQKPVALYVWCLKTFAKEGDKIFDPMMGSQSSRIAAYKMGFDYVGCEIDGDYFERGCKRFERECHGVVEQSDGSTVQQLNLF